MYLLIRKTPLPLIPNNVDLHPNMYLLIPTASVAGAVATGFTSQHVSINSLNT